MNFINPGFLKNVSNHTLKTNSPIYPKTNHISAFDYDSSLSKKQRFSDALDGILYGNQSTEQITNPINVMNRTFDSVSKQNQQPQTPSTDGLNNVAPMNMINEGSYDEEQMDKQTERFIERMTVPIKESLKEALEPKTIEIKQQTILIIASVIVSALLFLFVQLYVSQKRMEMLLMVATGQQPNNVFNRHE